MEVSGSEWGKWVEWVEWVRHCWANTELIGRTNKKTSGALFTDVAHIRLIIVTSLGHGSESQAKPVWEMLYNSQPLVAYSVFPIEPTEDKWERSPAHACTAYRGGCAVSLSTDRTLRLTVANTFARTPSERFNCFRFRIEIYVIWNTFKLIGNDLWVITRFVSINSTRYPNQCLLSMALRLSELQEQ